MQVDISNILSQGEGAQASFNIEGEKPELEGITLAAPLEGSVRVIGTKEGALTSGRLETEVVRECSRCLREFNHRIRFPFEAEYVDTPDDEQFQIDKYGKIDLAEPIRQELEVHLPLTALCQEDCGGIELNQAKET